MSNQEIICIQTTAFYSLLDEVVTHIDEKFKLSKSRQWIDSNDAMKLLNITSRTTLQKLRDEGKLRFSQPTKKGIMYDSYSITAYLEGAAQNTF